MYGFGDRFLLPMMIRLSNPRLLTIATITACVSALSNFSQTADAQSQSQGDLLFRNIGNLGVTLSVIALAVAAIYGSWKKQALTEAQNLAAVRKERILELEAEHARCERRKLELKDQLEDATHLALHRRGLLERAGIIDIEQPNR